MAKTKKSMLNILIANNPKLSRKEAIKLTNKTFEQKSSRKGKEDFIDRMEKKRQQELFTTGETGLYSFESDEAAANRAAVQANQEIAASGYFDDPTNFGNESSDSSDPYDGGLSDADMAGKTAGVNMDEYNKGGLAGKKKTPKPKKMKRGGLASR